MPNFHTQGAVPLDSEAYVQREFQDTIFERVAAGDWVLLLGPRQHGKTSGLLRLRAALSQAGFFVAYVDLGGVSPIGTYSHLLAWVVTRLADSLGVEPPTAIQSDSLREWLELLLQAEGPPIVICIDEASNIRNKEWLNSFYGQIREIANLRADPIAGGFARRIRFVFAGTFRPLDLLDPLNSPFNVCEFTDSEDLSIDAARNLALSVEPSLTPFVEPIFSYLGGQPFLLQTAFKAISQAKSGVNEATTTSVLRNFQDFVAPHLESLFERVMEEPKVLHKVGEMVQNGHTDSLPGDTDCSYLRVVGIAKREGSKLVFRNQFYRAVASSDSRITRRGAEVVALVHGIRTDAYWAEMVKEHLEEPGTRTVVAIRYDFMDIIQLLSPLRWLVIRRIRKLLQQTRFAHKGERFSIIAHSFGSFAVGTILKGNPDMVLDRLILCGAILPRDFEWEHLSNRINARVINECGTSDVWPLIAANLSTSYGASGRFGFLSPNVVNRFHDHAHSGCLDSKFVADYWAPIFCSDEVLAPSHGSNRGPSSYWSLVLARYRLLFWIGAIFAAWLGWCFGCNLAASVWNSF